MHIANRRCASPILTLPFFFFLMMRRPPRSTPLSLHDALPILFALLLAAMMAVGSGANFNSTSANLRSEEHTSELQSHVNLVCRLLLEKKKRRRNQTGQHYSKSPQSITCTSQCACPLHPTTFPC